MIFLVSEIDILYFSFLQKCGLIYKANWENILILFNSSRCIYHSEVLLQQALTLMYLFFKTHMYMFTHM